MAAMFQFYAIYAFVRLISEYLGDKRIFANAMGGKLPPKLEHGVIEFQSIIKTVAFLGAWAFIVLGGIRSIASFVSAELETFKSTKEIAAKLEEQLLSSLRMVFALLTLICIINMFAICKMSAVEEKMPQANAKFTGARMLLIVMEMQKSVLSVFTLGSPFNLRVERILGHEGFTLFTPEQYLLLHVTLLSWECLGIVALNVFWWKPWSQECFEHAQLAPGHQEDSAGLISTWWQVLKVGGGGIQESDAANGLQLSRSSSDMSSEAHNDGDDNANVNNAFDTDRTQISEVSLLSDGSPNARKVRRTQQ